MTDLGTARQVGDRTEMRYVRDLTHPPAKVWSDAFAQGPITQLEPERLLEVETDMHGTLRWELKPAGDGTRLVFTATTKLDSEQADKNLAGWHWHLDTLAMGLDGHEEDWEHWDLARWEQIYQRY